MEEMLMPVVTSSLFLKEQELVEKVTRAIRHATGGLVRGLKIEAVDNEIYVTGTTDSFYHKQLVTRAALEVCQHNLLFNNVIVR